ncbi:hypothetical protein D1007_56708 [Hordeum vulgare]|nr:hypothetical protein D1007_56708 [Hordeum vulgare]
MQCPSMAAPLLPRPHTPPFAPPSLRTMVPVLAPLSLNLDKIDKIHRISRDTRLQLLVGHAGSTDKLLVGHVGNTDELLVGVHLTNLLKTVSSPLDSARLPLAARYNFASGLV